MISKKIVFCVLLLLLFFIPKNTFAASNEFVTIVNPVRISSYTKNPKASVTSQYEIVRKFSLPATWLLTYDVLESKELLNVFNLMDERQEFGIFLEITPKLAKEAGISYHETGFWHHATSVFLSGYTQEERKQFIDAVFGKFKEEFGYLPSSVGSWWTDAYSLAYMKEKYGITANLGLADQYSTDGYQVWGGFWQAPFYPSKFHAGVPAESQEVKLDIVTIQWASRDPLNGYKNSLYSTQDYSISAVGLATEYFEKLVKFYAKKNINGFGQITVGLEGDLDPETYQGEFANQMALISKMAESGDVSVFKMSDFADWYREKFPTLSPPTFFESNDFLGKERVKIFWYQSSKYRIGILYDETSQKTKIFDFRTYHQDLEEPYFLLPNNDFILSIYIPSYFDEVANPEDIWEFSLGELQKIEKEEDEVRLVFDENKEIILSSGKISLPSTLKPPLVIKKAKALEVGLNKNFYEIKPHKNWIIGREGLLFRNLSSRATHWVSTKRGTLVISLVILFFLGANTFIFFSRLKTPAKMIAATSFILISLFLANYWYGKNSNTYFVSQSEVDTLFRLSLLPPGKVMVYDKECLGCSYHSQHKPAVFANKRGYVKKLGKHPIVYDSKVFEAASQEIAKEEFDKLGVDYIYVVRYEDYVEKTPFSPGDLGIEKIYSNANSELWRVKK